MESSLISGPVMSLIGITTVFVVLVSLVTLVSLMRSWFGDGDEVAPAAVPKSNASAAPKSSPSETPSDDPSENLLLVALATYAYHRSRGASATPPAQTTEWSSAGRVRQIASFSR